MSDADPAVRYQSRLAELERLLPRLQGNPAAADVGLALIAAGDRLRRSQAMPEGTERIDAALQQLPGSAILDWLRSTSLKDLDARIRRAADEALETMHPDSSDETETWTAWARQGLQSRDGIESALAAIARHQQLTGAQTDVKGFTEQLSAVDRALKQKARWFVALNAQRRAERDLLDETERQRAWWFSERAECDPLLQLLSGETADHPHLSTCSDCRRDLEHSRAAAAPRKRHLTADDLWRLDLGLMSSAERAVSERHARSCVECGRAVRALAEAEDMIEPRPSQPSSSPPAMAARRRGDFEVLDEQPDFRVVLQRRSKRLRLLIQPRRPERIAAVLLFREGGATPSRLTQSADGFEADLGEEHEARVAGFRLTVEIAGEGRYELPLSL